MRWQHRAAIYYARRFSLAHHAGLLTLFATAAEGYACGLADANSLLRGPCGPLLCQLGLANLLIGLPGLPRLGHTSSRPALRCTTWCVAALTGIVRQAGVLLGCAAAFLAVGV